jgi:hypothetical protein
MKPLLCASFSCAAALVAACSSDDTISDEDYDDVASALASTNRPQGGSRGGELGAMVDLGILARGGAVPGFSLSGNAWLGNRLGLSYRYELACHDTEDRSQLVCNDETDVAYVDVVLSGMLDLPFLHLQLDRMGDWTVTGLTTNAASLDGSGLMQLETRVERTDTTAMYELTYGADYRGITLARGEAWPRAGSIEYAIEVERTRTTSGTTDTRHFTLDARLNLAAGGRAMLTLDGSQHYQLELDSGVVARMAH